MNGVLAITLQRGVTVLVPRKSTMGKSPCKRSHRVAAPSEGSIHRFFVCATNEKFLVVIKNLRDAPAICGRNLGTYVAGPKKH